MNAPAPPAACENSMSGAIFFGMPRCRVSNYAVEATTPKANTAPSAGLSNSHSCST